MLSAKDNLGRCGVLLDAGSLCVSGCDGVESVHHLFLNCNIFDFLWYFVRDWVGVSAVDRSKFYSGPFLSLCFLSGGSKKAAIFYALVMTCYSLCDLTRKK